MPNETNRRLFLAAGPAAAVFGTLSAAIAAQGPSEFRRALRALPKRQLLFCLRHDRESHKLAQGKTIMTIATRRASRRSVLTGLAATPVAAFPPVVPPIPSECLTLAATREYRRLKAIETAAFAEWSRIFDARETKHRAIGAVEIQGETIYRLARLDFVWRHRGMPHEEYEAARAMLEPLQEAHDRVDEAGDCHPADAIATKAQEAATEALQDVLNTSPTSPAGALELLRIALEESEEAMDGSMCEFYRFTDAMRDAIEILEKAIGENA